MTTPTFTSNLTVDLIQHAGSDSFIADAARVSTGATIGSGTPASDAGLIGYLMRERHGSPFEHNLLTFHVRAPLNVWAQFMRHRVFSFNQESARYRKMQAEFYVFPRDRALAQAGSSAHPELVEGDVSAAAAVEIHTELSFRQSWESYESMLEAGVANEVARSVLPNALMSSAYVSGNVRALMGFLALRVDSPDNRFPTKPQAEIQLVAEQMEEHFAGLFPATHAAFVKHGRVSP